MSATRLSTAAVPEPSRRGSWAGLDDHCLPIGEDECRRLLASRSVGRVAVSVGAMPAILPVDYAVVDGDVVFPAAVGGPLAALNGDVIAFEVDRIDPVHGRGWTILLAGRARPVRDPALRDRLSHLGRHPSFGLSGCALVRLHPEVVAGWRGHQTH